MLISEVFYSIQGEGELVGVPSVFIRTTGCNLRCRWCDTPYASWKPEGKNMSLDEVLKAVMSFKAARHVVLTGGEPMVAPELPELAHRFRREGFHITIETAATIAPGDIPFDLASLSPKLSGSTPQSNELDPVWIARHEKTRFQPEVLRQWINAGPYQLKFVVGSEAELGEVDRLISNVGVVIAPHKVLLMPEGTESERLKRSGVEVAEWCKQRGYRFCDRLHVHLYGNTRGT